MFEWKCFLSNFFFLSFIYLDHQQQETSKKKSFFCCPFWNSNLFSFSSGKDPNVQIDNENPYTKEEKSKTNRKKKFNNIFSKSIDIRRYDIRNYYYFDYLKGRLNQPNKTAILCVIITHCDRNRIIMQKWKKERKKLFQY